MAARGLRFNRFSLLGLAALAATISSGCGKAPPEETMLGQWLMDKGATQKSNPLMAAVPGGMWYEFKADGSYAERIADGDLGHHKKGSWKQIKKDGATLTLQLEVEGAKKPEVVEIAVLGKDQITINYPEGHGPIHLRRTEKDPIDVPLAVTPKPEEGNVVKGNVLKGNTGGIWCLAISPDGATLAAGDDEYCVDLWDVAAKKHLAALTGHSKKIESLAFSPDGKRLASASEDSTVNLWDVVQRKALATLKGHTDKVNAVAFTSDGKTVISGSDDKTVKLWDVASGKETLTIPSSDYVNALAVSPDGKTLTYCPALAPIKLWDIDTRKERGQLDEHFGNIRAIAFTPDGKTLVWGGSSRTVVIWDFEQGKEKRRIELDEPKGRSNQVTFISITADGRTMVLPNLDKVGLWDLTTGKVKESWKDEHALTYGAVFSRDGKTLFSGGFIDSIKLKDVEKWTKP
jgi:WD40 repeat protein